MKPDVTPPAVEVCTNFKRGRGKPLHYFWGYILQQRDLSFIFVILFFTPSVASGDSSLTMEPWQGSEL